MANESHTSGPAAVARTNAGATWRLHAGWLLLGVWSGWIGLSGTAAGQSLATMPVDFARDIQPLLQQHCLDCHSGEAAESNLRLDSPKDALRGGDSGEPAVVPGDSQHSYLIARLTTEDTDTRMPPDAPPLAKADVDRLRAWIDQTDRWLPLQAELEDEQLAHWSFQPLRRPELPGEALPGEALPEKMGGHPLDRFIDVKLSAAGLSRSPAATRRMLIRRLYLVMHGLPPTPDQVQRFLADERDNAWELLVDEVLASPRYGERWATHWLDIVRFGETHGFETNRERPNAWPYRDWVINAFNSDLPYDRFVLAQLAGDTCQNDVATGFLVAGPYDLVKGQDPKLGLTQRQDELADMINTTGTAFLGLTLGCARCHNHKFDPVTQTDYYALQAIFAGVQHAERALPMEAAQQRELQAATERVTQLKAQLAKFIPSADREPWKSDLARRRAESGLPGPSTPVRPPVTARHNVETFAPTAAKFVRFTIQRTSGAQPCIDEFEVFSGDANIALSRLGVQATSSGDFQHPLHKLEHINDGLYGNAHSWIAQAVSGGWVQLEFPEPRTIERIEWARDREAHYADRLAIEYRIDVSADGQHWQQVASSEDRLAYGEATAPTSEYDFDAFPAAEAQAGQRLLQQLQAAAERQAKLSQPEMVYAGSFTQPGPTHRLYRGEATAPREEVAPAGIAALTDLQLPDDAPEQLRRRALAEWIASDHNPLTARVLVNRLWQYHFGTGIVNTPSDFGGNGELPSQPELLDWLAVECIEHGWSIKHMQRLILTSATWQQADQPTPAGISVDAGCRLLWRFPPRRLEAEAIRDSMLAVTGVLALDAGGPGFSSFQVDMENVRHYFPKQTFGPEDWRRMIFMTKVRQERDAVFGIFDCPDCNQVVPQRSRSTTPLQALNLLNSRFVLQQADLLAERLEREATSPQAKIQRAFELCFGRPAATDEVALASRLVEQTGWQAFARAMLNANEFVFIP